jgi:hypothetical protein
LQGGDRMHNLSVQADAMQPNAAIVRAFSIALAGLVCAISIPGLLVRSIYSRESPNWYAQAVAQDGFDLFFVVPALLLTAFFARTKNAAFLIWGGVVSYCVYTFVIYCFAIHFNILFLLYCLALGVSLFALGYFLKSATVLPPYHESDHKATPWVSYYLMIVAGAFYLLWLSEVIPASINRTLPNALTDAGLITNPVHVLDLSVCLPGLFLVGLFSLRRMPFALTLAPAALTFTILMDLTIATISVVLYMNDLAPMSGLPIIMGVMTLIGTSLLAWYLRGKGVTD